MNKVLFSSRLTSQFLLVIAIGFSLLPSNANELISLKDYLKSELSTSAKMSKESFELSADDKKAMLAIAKNAEDNAFTFYYGKNESGALEKACIVVPQKGKEGPLSIGVCFNQDGIIQSVKILAHQEERGKKIESEAFLKQFSGKKISDAFIVGKDVDGISGATWSSNYVSEALRKASFAFKKIKK